MDIGQEFLAEATLRFLESKQLAERALAQLDDAQFFHVPDPESNSAALIVKHMAGNMRSRWTDFLTTDGEKPDRNRDAEFEQSEADSREALMTRWNAGWKLVLDAIDALSPGDLERVVTIRSEPHTVLKAICRQITHYAYHSGQIVFLAKHLRSTAWQTLSVPRGGSAQFNATKTGRKP